MKLLLLFKIIAVSILLLSCSSQKTFTSLDKKYQESDFEALEKKSDKYIKKNPADPTPLYFKSITYLYKYNETGKPLNLRKAIEYAYNANRKSIPEFLKEDLIVLNETLIQLAADDLKKIEKEKGLDAAQKILVLSQKLSELPINKNVTVKYTDTPKEEKKPQKKKLPEGIRNDIVQTAQKYLGIPYKYGGTTTKGLDCSGFTGQVFRDVGITIPRTAALQAEAGLTIKENKAKPGDLLFFHNGSNKSRITHVALIIETDNEGIYAIMHATSKGVSIDKRDRPAWKSYWLPRIKMIASFIND